MDQTVKALRRETIQKTRTLKNLEKLNVELRDKIERETERFKKLTQENIMLNILLRIK